MITQMVPEYVRYVIESEPELPGDMPEEIFELIQKDRQAAEEVMRLTVRVTKQRIKERLGIG